MPLIWLGHVDLVDCIEGNGCGDADRSIRTGCNDFSVSLNVVQSDATLNLVAYTMSSTRPTCCIRSELRVVVFPLTSVKWWPGILVSPKADWRDMVSVSLKGSDDGFKYGTITSQKNEKTCTVAFVKSFGSRCGNQNRTLRDLRLCFKAKPPK